MKELKVGDIVTFRSDLKAGKIYGNLGMLSGQMINYVKGKTLRVKKALSGGDFTVETSPYIYNVEMLVQPKYKAGDKVRIVDKWPSGSHKNGNGLMDHWLGKVMTVREAYPNGLCKMEEDKHEITSGWTWWPDMIAGLAKEVKPMRKSKFKVGDIVVGNEANRYAITHEGWKGRVVKVYEKPITNGYECGDIEVRKLGHECGCKYTVYSDRFDLVTSEESKSVTINVYGNKTVAKLYKDGTVVKTAVAKCSPNDEFDFETGAKLAMERLFEKVEKPKRGLKIVRASGNECGRVGIRSDLKDINGEKLYVGDVVELFDRNMKSYGDRVVSYDTESGYFIMSIALSCRHGEIDDRYWRIIKRKSYSEMRAGDVVDTVRFVAG